MAATKTASAVRGRDEANDVFRQEGCSMPSAWSNGPGDTYGWHSHAYRKVLFCLDGSITFHTKGGDVELREGDRLDITRGTEHAATVGVHGVSCVEAARR
jgi:mannose-6-phosphate isomerase-like protein (cupin superfamily)